MAPMAGLRPTFLKSIETPAAAPAPRAAASRVASSRYCSRRGRLSIAKILKADDVGVHVCAYRNRLESRPPQVDSASRDTARVDDEPLEPGAAGHLPLRRQTL
jgi:hypothetical protein